MPTDREPVVEPLPYVWVTDKDVGATPDRNIPFSLMVAGVVIAGVSFRVFSEYRWWGLLAGIAIGVVLTLIVVELLYSSNVEVHLRKTLEAAERRRETARRDAACLTQELRAELRQFPKNAGQLIDRHKRLFDLLMFAWREFEARAYSSFWDVIAAAKNELEGCSQDVEKLAKRLRTYGKRLEGRRHDFPLMPDLPKLPNISIVASEFALIARGGETDYQFASILEHKKTRVALIGGFASIEGAIDSIGIGLERDLNALRFEVAEAHRLQAVNSAKLQVAVDQVVVHTASSAETDRRVSQVIDKQYLLDD